MIHRLTGYTISVLFVYACGFFHGGLLGMFYGDPLKRLTKYLHKKWREDSL